MRHITRILWKMKHERRGRKKSRRQREAAQNPKMGPDLLTNLPSDIIMNILLRLPVRAAMSCKCVCKALLGLLATPEFMNSHLSKSVPGLVVLESGELLQQYKVYEFADELDHNLSVPHWDVALNFNFPHSEPAVLCSANGLIVLCRRIHIPFPLFICNPVTREYIMPPCPFKNYSCMDQHQLDTYGFGVSRVSGKYKLVRIFYGINLAESDFVDFDQTECEVYTVGTGSWRAVPSAKPRTYEFDLVAGALLNGNLHWSATVHDRDSRAVSMWISCFDLETELFSTFSAPALARRGCRHLSALRGCLCFCDNSDVEIVIWSMKEYGDGNSWTKEFIIPKMGMDIGDFSGILWPIKVFKDGDILMQLMEGWNNLFYYSNKNKTVELVYVHQGEWDYRYRYSSAFYTPSFVSLKTFAMESVTSY